MAIRQYIGARYVPAFFENSATNDSTWASNTSYEALTMVTWNNNIYTSKKPVPANIGNPAENPQYWIVTSNVNEQVAEIQEQIGVIDGEISEIQSDIEDLQEGLDDTNDDVDALDTRVTAIEQGGGFNIDALTADTTMAEGDELAFYDISATANKKITLANARKAFNVPNLTVTGNPTVTPATGYTASNNSLRYAVSADGKWAKIYGTLRQACGTNTGRTFATLSGIPFAAPSANFVVNGVGITIFTTGTGSGTPSTWTYFLVNCPELTFKTNGTIQIDVTALTTPPTSGYCTIFLEAVLLQVADFGDTPVEP